MVYFLLSFNIFSKKNILKSFKLVIIINASFFLIQFFTYELTGHLIDFNNYIREEYAHTIYGSRALDGFIIGIRATGLYSEPSFYAMSIFPCAIAISVYERRIGTTLVIALITCLLSLSIAAIGIAFISLLVYYRDIWKSKWIMMSLILILIISTPFLYHFIMIRLFENTDYDAIGSRMMIFNEFEVRGLIKNIFGSGFFWDQNRPIGQTGLGGAHIRDSSFYIYLFFSSGLFGICFLLWLILFVLPSDWKIKFVFCTSLLFKFGVLTASFWCLISLLMVIKYQGRTQFYKYV
jgi:hypothetical protein